MSLQAIPISLERISLLGERCEARYCNWRWPNEKAAEKYPVDRYLFPLMGKQRACKHMWTEVLEL